LATKNQVAAEPHSPEIAFKGSISPSRPSRERTRILVKRNLSGLTPTDTSALRSRGTAATYQHDAYNLGTFFCNVFAVRCNEEPDCQWQCVCCDNPRKKQFVPYILWRHRINVSPTLALRYRARSDAERLPHLAPRAPALPAVWIVRAAAPELLPSPETPASGVGRHSRQKRAAASPLRRRRCASSILIAFLSGNQPRWRRLWPKGALAPSRRNHCFGSALETKCGVSDKIQSLLPLLYRWRIHWTFDGRASPRSDETRGLRAAARADLENNGPRRRRESIGLTGTSMASPGGIVSSV
jgi:hypothetical protein